MANEIRIVDEYGATATVAQLRDKKFVAGLSNDDLEAVAYTAKALKSPLKNIEDETKKRLQDGQQFTHISLTEARRQNIAQDDEKLKKAFVKKYGWGAVQVKTPTALKREFGEAIQEDLDKVVVYDTQQRAKFD